MNDTPRPLPRPMRGELYFRRTDIRDVTEGGVVIPEIARGQSYADRGVVSANEAEVVAVGPPRVSRGVAIESGLRVGDKIAIPCDRGTLFMWEGEHYYCANADDIAGVIE